MNRLLLIGACVLTLAACSDAPEPDTPPAEAVQPLDTAAARLDAVLDAGAVPASSDTAVKPGTVGAATDSKNLLVTMEEGSAKISHSEIEPGQVTVVMENKGTQPHTMEIRNPLGGRWRTPQVAPNSQSSVTMVLGRGTYEVFCTMTHGGKAHKDAGAMTKLEVK
jgi:plastocyanin